VAAFAKMQKHYQTVGDQWRERNYRTALEVVRKLPIEVVSAKDLHHPALQRLGQKTRDKILEFLLTGHIERAERIDTNKMSRALEELQDIWGVGLATARQWLGRGCRTVEDVRRYAPELGLSADQEIGLRYFEEFRQRIPRAEAAQIIEVVRSAIQRLACPGLRMEACGSYRRGAPTCGDVDILVTVGRVTSASWSRATALESEVLSRLLKELEGFLTDHLKGRSFERGEERSRTAATYFGVCQLCPDKPHRRIDIKVYPDTERPFALLAFTGSGHFNRSMRLYARRAGYTLSDHNIRPAKHAKGVGCGERIWAGPKVATVPFDDERDIFTFLGLAYREPHEREVDARWLAETAASGEVEPQSVCDCDASGKAREVELELIDSD
jgi:DNA polymerase/3'-5' exonuclease PolX